MAQPEGKKKAESTIPTESANPLQTKEETYGENYKEHLLQQYLMYVQTADEVSSRRALANTFFLSASTVFVSIDGLVLADALTKASTFGIAFIIVFSTGSILFSGTWYFIIRSYDKLNTGKFDIIHQLEKALPATLFASEWVVLGRGKDPSKYRPISRVEARVPLIFIAVYISLIVGVLIVYLY